MYALVIYDLMFGNTEQVARAIGQALSEGNQVDVRPIAELDGLPTGVDLVVIGGPTQGHGADREMKAFLDRLPDAAVRGVAIAVFDTRLRWPELLSGSAAKDIAKRLERKGARLVAKPESFFVNGKEGPLDTGELDRASSWARQIAGSVAGHPEATGDALGEATA